MFKDKANKLWGFLGIGVFILRSCDTLHTGGQPTNYSTNYVTSEYLCSPEPATPYSCNHRVSPNPQNPHKLGCNSSSSWHSSLTFRALCNYKNQHGPIPLYQCFTKLS